MSGIPEMLALLTPGSVSWDGVGVGGSDIRQQLSAALARARPQWAGDLLLARYADDHVALRTVESVLLTELATMVWPDKNPPGTLRGVVGMVLSEYVDPPPCLSCAGTASTWRMVDGAIVSIDCQDCGGRGRRRLTDDELASLCGLPWSIWRPRYVRLHRMLRVHERSAVEALREALADQG